MAISKTSLIRALKVTDFEKYRLPSDFNVEVKSVDVTAAKHLT
jgi:hypothetical protein